MWKNKYFIIITKIQTLNKAIIKLVMKTNLGIK